MEENSLSVVPRDVMLNELGNAQLLGGHMQSSDQINPSQFQDAATCSYQVTDDFSFAASPIQDSIPFGFLGADEIEGFNNYVGGCESLEAAGGAIDHFLGNCEALEAAVGAPDHFLGNCESLEAAGGAPDHILGDYEFSNVVEGSHEHVLGDYELLKVVGAGHERLLDVYEPLKAVGGAHEHLDAGIAVENVSGQEMNWSDMMLKVLITSVSYLGDVDSLPYTTKSDWEAISEVMVQRGYTVTPLQCHDKFKDLKYVYERFSALLGKDACHVIEYPILLESMDLSNEAKVEVRNLIYSKQLFYKEMWSCLNGNRTFIPLDIPLVRSLAHALKSKHLPGSEMPTQGASVKGKRPLEDRLGKSLATPSNTNACSGERAKINGESLRKLQDQKAELLAKRLEFEKEKFEWRIAKLNIDWEMTQMRLQNELLKLENERLALELQTRNIVP